LYLGLLAQPSILSLTQLKNICSDLPQDFYRLELLYRAHRFDYLEAKEEQFRATLELILNSSLNLDCRRNRRPQKSSLLELLSYAVDAMQYAYAFHDSRPVPLADLRQSQFYLEAEYFDESMDQSENSRLPKFEDARKCLEIINISKQHKQLDAYLWATSLTPWNNLVEAIRQCWGDKWICFHLANIASGIKSIKETYVDYSNLLDHSKDLCKRVRYARLRAGQYTWWMKQLENSKSEIDKAVSILILITWASPNTLKELISKLDEFVQSLSDSIWTNVYSSIEEALGRNQNVVMSRFSLHHPKIKTKRLSSHGRALCASTTANGKRH
jgi:hypothetical protein